MPVDKTVADDKKHFGDVTSVCYHDGKVYSAGSDGKIKIWDKDLNFIRELNIHEAHIYAITVDRNGRLYSSSCDGTVKTLEKPLESDNAVVLLEHANEIEAIVVDENLRFYCGDDHGGISVFEDFKFKFMMNVVEHVKGLAVEKNYVYTLANMDLSIHEMKGEKYMMKGSVPGKFPVALLGEKVDGRSKYIAILTRDGLGVTIINNGGDFKALSALENLHSMIVNAMQSNGDFLFSCDYAGKVIKTQLIDGKLVEIDSAVTESGCCNCITVADKNTVYVGSLDGTVKRIVFK